MYSWDEKFVWNFYLIQDLLSIIKFKKWILPVVHGYINMLSKLNIIAIILFRSRISSEEAFNHPDWPKIKTFCWCPLSEKRHRS